MTFSQISSLFEQAQATQPWAKDLTFEQFAAMGAQATGDPEMQRISQAGAIENTVRGLNQGLTELVNTTPLDEWLGSFTGSLGEAVGVDKQAATAVGQSLPRQVANIAPYFIPYVGPYVSAGLSAVDTYDQTGSTWQAGISAIAPAAVSKAATAGGNALLQAAAKSPTMQKLGVTGATALAPRLTNIGLRGQDLPIGSAIQDTVVRGLANKATKFTGEAIAGQAAGLGLDIAAQGFDAVANKEYLFANLIGNLAFSPLNIPDFIGTKVVSSKEIVPDKFDPIFTPEQKRAFDFESLIKSLDPVEQSRMAKASGFDIAQQYLTEQTLSNLDSEYTTARTEARQKLESDWQALRAENSNIPELSSIKKPDDIPLELYTTARTRYDEYDMLVRKLNQEERMKVKSALVKPNVMSLQKVAMDDLQLQEKLLGKPVQDRTLKDYQDALVDKISDRGVKVIYAMHKKAAGLPVELQVKGIADEVEKMLRKEPTAFAEDRAFVAASLWALGERPTPLKVVKEQVEKKVKEGEKVSKAVASVNKKDAARAAKKVRGADKKKRKVNEAVTQRVEGIEQEVKQAGEAADARKASEEQKVLLDAYRYASEQSGGDESTFRAMMSSLSKVWSSGKSKEDKLKEFKGKVQTILQNKQATRERKEVVGLDEARLTKEEVQETELKDFENDTDTDGEGFVDEALEDETVTESAQVVSQDKAIEKEMLRLVMDNRDLGAEQAREFLNMLSPEKTKALWKIAEANITTKFARNANENTPQVGLQQTMSFDKWADVLLENEGFTARETQELKEHFAKVVEIFYSPEVKYGFLDEFPLESKLAKGYIGVVGEGGVRWKFGELNQMVHDDYPELKARLAETKFRYRDDNQTLYKWGHITEVELENIKAKLAKLGKEVKTVKLITTGNVAEAHGITTLFGPEPGQKVKWANGVDENSLPASNVPGSATYAAAVEATRQIFLNPKALEGLSPLDKVRVQASLTAHELSHILIHKARNNAFGPEAKALVDEMEAWVQTANPQDVDVVVETMADVFLDKRTRGLPGVEDVIKNLRDNRGQMDKDEVLANMYGIWATGLHQVKDPGRFYTLLPRVVRDMFDWVAEKVQGVVRAAQMYVKFGGDQEKLKRVQNVRDVFAAVRRGARKAEENLSELNELANLNQADVVDFAEAKFAKGVYGGSGKTRSVVENWADNWLVRLGSLAATYEGLKKPYLAMVDTMPLTADLTAQALAGLGWGDYSYTGLVFKKGSATERIHRSKPLHRLASKINVELNKMADVAVVEENGKYRFDTSKLSPEVKGELAAFAPDAQAAVAEYFIKRSKESMPVVHGTIVGKEWEAQRDMVHLSLVNLSEFKTEGGYKKAEVLAEQLMQKARQGDAAGVEELLGQMQDKVDAEKFGKYLRGVVSDLRELEADYKKNPAFGSLRRFQPIKQKWTKGSETVNMQARTAKEAEQKAADLEARGYKPGRVIITDYKHKGEWVMEGASKQRLKDREDRLKALIDDLPIDETVRNELKKEVSFVQQLETDEAAQSVFSTSVKRNFAEGVEELDVLEQDILFASKAISAANKKALRSKVKVSMLNPELDQHLDAKNTFEQAYENFNSQNHDLLRKMSKANAAYFIGFNLPGHVAELMQPVMTHLAEMRNIGLGALESLGVIKGSSSDVFNFYKRNLKKFAKREEVHIWDDWSNPEEKEMLQEFKHVINANPLDYAFDEMGFRQQQLMETTEVGKPKTLAQLVASPAVAYGNMGLKFYNLFTRHNAIIGLLGGYRAYRKAGLSHQEAKEKVRLYEVVVNKSGGRADRQASPFKGNALLGHLFYGLQGYTTGWFSQLLTYFRHGYLSKDYAGFKDNPQAVKNARSALWTMLGAQLGAAGLMGMPFVGALTALYEEFSGDDLRGDIYESLDEVTNDPLLTQAASHGVASALAERLGIPADLHSRFAIGGLLGFNSYDGFSASSLLGPTAGMVNSLWNMGSTFSQERDLRKALDAGGPTGLRSIAKALDEELPLRGESRLGTLLGFKSSNIRKEQEFERIAQKRNEKAARDVSHAARRIQENLGRGSQYVQAKVIEEAKKLLGEDQSPEAMKSMISKLASKVRQYEEEKRLPPDLRKTATAQTAEPLGQLARAMGVNLPQSQEVDRELLKQGVYHLMGLPTRSRLMSAYQTDLETTQDPYSFR